MIFSVGERRCDHHLQIANKYLNMQLKRDGLAIPQCTGHSATVAQVEPGDDVRQ